MKREYSTPTLIIDNLKTDDVLTASDLNKERENAYVDVFTSIFWG